MRSRKTGGALRLRPAGLSRTGKAMMNDNVKIVAILAARPGQGDGLRALLDAMLAPSRAETGNLRYDLWRDPADPVRFVLDELYVDADAVAAHRATPHFQDYLAKIGDLADRTALVVEPIDVAPAAPPPIGN
jgi:quinol monooxygenase YgiN